MFRLYTIQNIYQTGKADKISWLIYKYIIWKGTFGHYENQRHHAFFKVIFTEKIICLRSADWLVSQYLCYFLMKNIYIEIIPFNIAYLTKSTVVLSSNFSKMFFL